MKTFLTVILAVTVGSLAANAAQGQLEKLAAFRDREAATKSAINTGVTAASSLLLFGIFRAMLGSKG